MSGRIGWIVLAWGAATSVCTLTGGVEAGPSPAVAPAVMAGPQHGDRQVAPQVASPQVAPQQGGAARGVKVTYERVLPRDREPQVQSQRARLLSLAVERGEVPSPFLEPGYFRATFEARVAVASRDRYRFRIAGRGKVKLEVNGKVVLAGGLRSGQPLETSKSVRLGKGDNDLKLSFESSAFGEGELRLYWAPPDCGYEPIQPQLLSWPADDPAIVAGEERRSGHELFAERRCARCHQFDQRGYGESAYGELSAGGPDLRTVGSRLSRDWMAAWLLDPTQFRHDARMPSFDLTADEANDVATWLGTLGEPLQFDVPAGKVDAGKDRFLQLGCIACHVPPDRAREASSLGDRLPLHHVRQKWHAAALVTYLQDPQQFYPHVRMPDMKLSRDEAIELAAYLLQAPLQGQPQALPAVDGDAKEGRRIAQRKQCAACHDLDVPLDDEIGPDLQNVKPARGCLAETAKGRGDAPNHRLDKSEIAALRAFLPDAETAPFRLSPLDYSQRHLQTQRCTACHALDDHPSTWAQVANELAADEPLPPEQDPAAQGVPALTWVGSKLQPSWIEQFVIGELPSPRPWLHARMPAFELRGKPITAGLVREHGYGAGDEQPVAPQAQMAIHGRTLLMQGTGFGCVQCHALGDKKAEQVFEREGIELYLARKRLRHEYYSRWLLDPPRIDPDARMPKYANQNGKTAFTEILGGDAARQFEAIWQFLGSQR